MNEMQRLDERIAEEKKLRAELEQEHSKVWDSEQVVEEFDVQGFKSPFALVIRKSDNQDGTLRFTHMPRFYFDFEEGWP